MITLTHVHMRGSARAAARADKWSTEGDAPTPAWSIGRVAHVESFEKIQSSLIVTRNQRDRAEGMLCHEAASGKPADITREEETL